MAKESGGPLASSAIAPTHASRVPLHLRASATLGDSSTAVASDGIHYSITERLIVSLP